MGARILVVDDSPTIRKVVTRILERNSYETLTAADGVEALQVLASEHVDLMLVDFVMPRMNGYQLCLSVRQNERLRALPVILMSAKGDKIRGKFVQQTGALDAITKPFDARGLLAVVESALLKAQGGRTEVPARDEQTSSPESGSDVPGQSGVLAAAQLGQRLADLALPELNRLGQTDVSREQLARAFGSALSEGALEELAAAVAAMNLAPPVDEILSGDLGAISIAEILQLLEQQRKTGALTLHHRRKRVTLEMREGSLDFASHEGLTEEFLLGRYLADGGSVQRPEVERHVLASRRDGRVIGDYLVSQGIISAAALLGALKRQTSELVYEVVRWRTGRFRFVVRDADELASRARLGLQTAGLVMEGFRRVDEWRLIEDSFDFSDVLFCDALAIANFRDHEGLSPEELRVLGAIDDDASVGEILDSLGGTSFENCKILYRLLNARLVKRRTV